MPLKIADNLFDRCDTFHKLATELPKITRTSQISINHSGMRDESMEKVRQQRERNEKMRPIVVTVFPDGLVALNDGRHRLSVAKERGDLYITAQIIYYDNDLDIVHEELHDLLIDN
jgi:hypothetical protein